MKGDDGARVRFPRKGSQGRRKFEDLGHRDVAIEVGGDENNIADAKLAIQRAPECVGFDAEVSQRYARVSVPRLCAIRCTRWTPGVRPIWVSPSQVLDGVLADSRVEVAAQQDAAPPAGGPREDAAHEVPPQEMARHRQRGCLEKLW